VRISAAVREQLGTLRKFAPLHVPQELGVIDEAMQVLPGLPHVAVFDTAFHATLPPEAARYALPEDLCRDLGIRRFGFHGLSHAHVNDVALAQSACSRRIISCHLGNGASVAAIENGACVDTSMGMTPLEGLVMGTRAGDLDPGIVLALLRSGRYRLEDVERLLNEGAGLRGLTGTSDVPEIESRAQAGDAACALALSLYAYRVRKYIGAYAAALGGVEVIAFTGGIGQNGARMRSRCLEKLGFLGALVDEEANERARVGRDEPVAAIGSPASSVRILVVAANEEQVMARDVARFAGSP
jgi:acetate kinase